MELFKANNWKLNSNECWVCDKHVFGLWFYADNIEIEGSVKLDDKQLEDYNISSVMDKPNVLGPFNDYQPEQPMALVDFL